MRFNRTRIPRPPAEQSPASSEPKLIVFLTNNNVNSTDIAQLGIKPINETITGCNGEFKRQYFARFSSVPTIDKIYPSIKDTISIKIKIFNVCFNGCSQKSFVFAASAI